MLSQLLHSNIQLHLHLVTLKHTGGAPAVILSRTDLSISQDKHTVSMSKAFPLL